MFALLLVVSSSFASDPPLPARLSIGAVTYENVRWGTVTPADVTIFHATGVATIPLARLPADMQERFNYRPAAADSFTARERSAVAARLAASAETRRVNQLTAQYADAEFKEPIATGTAGVFKSEVEIMAVLGVDSVLARVPVLMESSPADRSTTTYIGSVEAVRSVSEYRAVALHNTGMVWAPTYRTIILRGVKTGGLSDNAKVMMRGVFEVVDVEARNGGRFLVMKKIGE